LIVLARPGSKKRFEPEPDAAFRFKVPSFPELNARFRFGVRAARDA
jgi:hypothetical protein